MSIELYNIFYIFFRSYNLKNKNIEISNNYYKFTVLTNNLIGTDCIWQIFIQNNNKFVLLSASDLLTDIYMRHIDNKQMQFKQNYMKLFTEKCMNLINEGYNN